MVSECILNTSADFAFQGKLRTLKHHLMETAMSLARLVVIGMGHVMGITPAVPQPQHKCNEYGVIGGDFWAVGNDFRAVMRKYPPTPETARQLGESAQLELAGISESK
jgi:hypothetical protein